MAASERVLIIGGGIGGLAAANALRTNGLNVTVFEQADELREIGAAIGVQTNAVKALRSMGRADAMVAQGVEIEHWQYFTWRGRKLVDWRQGEIGRKLGAPNVVIHRADLQTALGSGLPDGVVELDRHCVGYEEDASGVTARFADGSEERGEVLIGCDGIRSGIRKQLLGDTPLRYAGWIAMRGITTFSHPSIPVGICRQFIGRGRTFGMWHLTGGRIYWVGSAKMPANSQDAPGGRKREILDWCGNGPEPVRALIEATDESAMLRNDINDREPVDRWSSRRVTLLGDAAHPTTPVTGQGGGQAIEDAAVLARMFSSVDKLSDGDAVEAAFRRYEAERAPRTASITNEAWTIAGMHHWTNPVVCWVRDIGMKAQPQKVWDKRMELRLDTYQE